MAKVKVCDGCGKPIKEVVAKMFYSDMNDEKMKPSHHSHYTMHADLGICCAPRFKTAVRWQKRKPKGSNSNGTGSSVAQKVN